MQSSVQFYRAGCPVYLDAEAVGMRSVPALTIGGQTFHINYGAAIADLKQGDVR